MGVFQTMPISFGHFPSENPPTFPALEPGKIPQFRRYFMKTGLNKRQKTTAIYFDEYNDLIEVQTHNTELKNASHSSLPSIPGIAARPMMTSKAA